MSHCEFIEQVCEIWVGKSPITFAITLNTLLKIFNGFWYFFLFETISWYLKVNVAGFGKVLSHHYVINNNYFTPDGVLSRCQLSFCKLQQVACGRYSAHSNWRPNWFTRPIHHTWTFRSIHLLVFSSCLQITSLGAEACI